MSSFTSHLHQISPEATSTATSTHDVGPTPVDAGALFQLLQDQLSQLATSAPNETNRAFLEELYNDLAADVHDPPKRIRGVTQEYLDCLDRVPKSKLKKDDDCPICGEPHLDDPYPLVVRLPCHDSHRFDLECVGPWLLSKGNCPMCRKDLTEKKKIEIPVDDEEDDADVDGLYG
jgi:hypothetical protein